VKIETLTEEQKHFHEVQYKILKYVNPPLQPKSDHMACLHIILFLRHTLLSWEQQILSGGGQIEILIDRQCRQKIPNPHSQNPGSHLENLAPDSHLECLLLIKFLQRHRRIYANPHNTPLNNSSKFELLKKLFLPTYHI
jgi:hypothetical protein